MSKLTLNQALAQFPAVIVAHRASDGLLSGIFTFNHLLIANAFLCQASAPGIYILWTHQGPITTTAIPDQKHHALV